MRDRFPIQTRLGPWLACALVLVGCGSDPSSDDDTTGSGAAASSGEPSDDTTTSGAGGSTNASSGSGASGAEGPNDFFDEMAARPETVFTYSLRDQAQIDELTHGANPETTVYDADMDAVRITLPANINSAQQIWMPIYMEDAGQTVIIWDWRGSDNWVYENGLRGHKMFQVRRQSDHIWVEPGHRYLPEPEGTRHSRVRFYQAVGPDTISPDGGFDFSDEFGAVHYDSDAIGPVHSNFTSPRDTWTRFMLVIEQRPDDEWAHVWYYGADEGHDPVPILVDAQVGLASDDGVLGAGRPHHFDFEINSSGGREGPEVWCWGRNVVVMRGVEDPASLLRRPVR